MSNHYAQSTVLNEVHTLMHLLSLLIIGTILCVYAT